MPTARIPLVGTYNQRGLSGNAALVLNEDQRFLNATFEVVTNPITGKSTVYVSKRPGWGQDSLVDSGNASTGLIQPQSFAAILTAFRETNSIIYFGTTNVGTITGRALHFTETLISGVGCVAIKSSDGTGWYYMDGAKDQTAYTGDTHTNTTIDNLTDTSKMYAGQKISGAGIVAGTRIASITSSTAIVTDTATTASATVSITKEPIAKIIDSDFVSSGTYRSAFAAMDGYLFYADDSGYVNNSDLNSVALYTANARIAAQMVPDPTIGVAIQKNIVVAFGTGSNEKFQNAGFSSGSPLQVLKQQVEHIGALDQRSIDYLEDDIFYVSSPISGDIRAYRMRGLQSTAISNSVVDRIIGTVSVSGAIYTSCFRLGGYPYAAFVVSMASDGPASNFLLESGDILLLEATPGGNLLLEDTASQTASFVRMMVYNSQLNIWCEWDCNQCTFIDSIGTGTANKLIASSRVNTSGKVYRIDPVADGQLYQDDGSTFSMQIRTAKLDFGTAKRKFINAVYLNCDQQSAGTVTLEASTDDYQSWFTVGTFDITETRPKITKGRLSFKGSAAFRLTHNYNGAFRGESIEFDYTVGTQ